jgi:hypothetical protein
MYFSLIFLLSTLSICNFTSKSHIYTLPNSTYINANSNTNFNFYCTHYYAKPTTTTASSPSSLSNGPFYTNFSNLEALFSKMPSIYSELIAVPKHDGQLHQWKRKWPFVSKISLNTNLDTSASSTSTTDHPLISLTIYHLKVLYLKLLNESICDASAATVRASCWTEVGKV